ncbi:hypothetical protein K402DRAFT_393042 [Aulographum hederae CBS 113979]|uniref:DAGKc domain-containing protein n=1 Tax=Aulographum hederae CBS 113979 TaxID=1176131 RepID=A0A6G1H2D7_9PEZI|nr:hypothetical protein K402DRAFT_393042 [Aulographum hederae CBS 113979]
MSYSEPVICAGFVDTHPVSFEYTSTRYSNQLKYTYQQEHHSVLIDSRDLVGVVADSTKEGKSYCVLYLDKVPPDAKIPSIPTLRSASARDLPQEFVDKYAVQAFRNILRREERNDDGEPNIHVIVSVLSGVGLATNFHESVLRPILDRIPLRADIDYKIHYTESSDTITDLTKNRLLPRAEAGVAQHIVLLSGDGGVVDVINALLTPSPSSSYVPPTISLLALGTGNALAHSTGITADDTLGLSTLALGSAKQLPLLKATFSPGALALADEASRKESLPATVRTKAPDGTEVDAPTMYGAVVASWGLHAALVADSDTAEYRKHGVQRFAMAANANLFPADGSPTHPYQAQVSVLRSLPESGGEEEWEPIKRETHAYVLATLVSNLEKEFTISPASKPLSGTLHLVEFGPMNGTEVMRVMGLAYQGGKHVDEEVVGYHEVEGVRIDFKDGEKDERFRRICIDGTIIVVEQGGWVEIQKENRKVVELVGP